MEDTELLELLHSDPDKGMDALVKKYSGLVCSVIRGRFEGFKYLSSDIEDCAADSFSDFWLGLKGFDPERSSIKTYLTAIARNNACDLLKKNGWRQNSVDVTGEDDDPVLEIPDSCDEAELIDEKKRREKLFREIEALGEPDSSIMFRKYYLGESSKSIAEATGMTAANVDNRAHRAVLKLKKLFGIG